MHIDTSGHGARPRRHNCQLDQRFIGRSRSRDVHFTGCLVSAIISRESLSTPQHFTRWRGTGACDP